MEEREHGNSYVLATEGTDKTFIRGQQLLKHHSVPKHSQVNKVLRVTHSILPTYNEIKD